MSFGHEIFMIIEENNQNKLVGQELKAIDPLQLAGGN